MTLSPPQGQEQMLRALAVAMLRGAAGAAAVATTASVIVAGVVAGVGGAVSAVVGAGLVVVSSLLTLWLMHRTAALEPGVVLIALMGGFLLKMILLLMALFLVGDIDGVHRGSLALTMLALFIVVAGAESWAGYRMRTLTLEPAVGLVASHDPTTQSDLRR